MAKHRRRKQKNRDRATGKNNPVHHEAAPKAVQRPPADAPPAPEQPTTEASPTSAAQNPEPHQAHQPTRQADPHAEPAITDPGPTARAPARSRGSMVEVNDKPDWEVTPYRPPTVTRAKTRMQLGEWEQLAELDGNEVISGAPVTELQLMAAIGHLQKGGESARDRARTLLLEAMDAGADRKLIARMLIAGASNTLGRLAALTGRSDQKVLEHFRSAISISDPEADVDLMLHPMAARQLGRLATNTGSRKIQEMAQRAALTIASCNTDPFDKANSSRDFVHEYWRDSEQPPSHYRDVPPQRSLRLVELFIDHVKPGPILEIGCNVGRNLHHLFAAGYTDLVGIEISEQAVAMMRDTYPELSSIPVHVGPVEDFIHTFLENSFECVFTMAVLEHIHFDSDWIFSHIAKITKMIITVEDELRSTDRHFSRNYERIFSALGMKQVHLEGPYKFALPTGFSARVFIKKK